MKRIFTVLLIFAVVGGVFADVSVYGRVRTNIGADIPFEPESADAAWIFEPHARIGFRGGNDVVNFFAQFDANANPDGTGNLFTGIRYNATVKLGDVSLSLGRTELPWVQWSSLAIFGNTNSGFGASNTLQPYFTVGYSGAYLGLTSASRIHGKSFEDFPLPGFFAGYDFSGDGFSVGGAFAGLFGQHQVLAAPADKDAIFSWLGNVHGKYTIDLATIGLNFSFYGAPEFGFFNLPGQTGTAPTSISAGKDALVLEALLDVSLRLADNLTVGVSGAVVANVAEEAKGGGGSALRAGLSANLNIGGGFRVIPGAIFTHYINGAGGVDIENSNLLAGVTFLFTF